MVVMVVVVVVVLLLLAVLAWEVRFDEFSIVYSFGLTSFLRKGVD